MIKPYQYPTELDRSTDYTVSINGMPCEVLRVPFHGGKQADVVICACEGALDIAIQCTKE